jgi:hypothetical protein
LHTLHREMVIVLFLILLCALPACGAPSGKELVERHCTACHLMAPIEVAEKSYQDWKRTVWRMVDLGAKLSDKEAETVIDYLTTIHGAQ